MSLVDESLEFNSFLGGELVTVESESTTEIIYKNRLGDIYRSRCNFQLRKILLMK